MEKARTLKRALQAYWDRQPCNARHSHKPIGSREYFLEVAARRYRVEPHIAEFAEFGKWKGKYVLELGCGIGTDAVSFALFGAHVTACDQSQASIEIVKANREAFALEDDLVPILDDLANLCPFHIYDLIWCFGVIHHMPDPTAALNLAKSSLACHGELRLMVYSKWSLKNLTNHLGWTRPEAQKACPLAHTYSKREITKLLRDNGFEVISIKKDHHFIYSIPEYRQGREVAAFPWNVLPGFVLKLVKRFFGWHLLLKARLAR